MRLGSALSLVAALAATTVLGQTFFGPTPYLQPSDGPFFGFLELVIEDAEDGLFNLPGASSNHTSLSSSFGVGLIDSVDIDDGIINGTGQTGPLGPGDAFWSSGNITITFGVGGAPLPTYAGLVWTDGVGIITFEAYGPTGLSLGAITGNHADGSITGGTDEDRFYGVHFAEGISKITIRNGGGIEADHIQIAGGPPGPARVRGTALLDGYQGLTAGGQLEVEVWQVGSLVETLYGNYGANGAFACSPTVSGVMTLKFRFHTALWKAVGITLGSEPITDMIVTMSNGDCDHDNEVTIGDFAVISASFGREAGDPGFDEDADLNGDESVDIGDFAILSSNFGAIGD